VECKDPRFCWGFPGSFSDTANSPLDVYIGLLKDSAMRRNVNVSFKNHLHMTSKSHMGRFPDEKNFFRVSAAIHSSGSLELIADSMVSSLVWNRQKHLPRFLDKLSSTRYAEMRFATPQQCGLLK